MMANAFAFTLMAEEHPSSPMHEGLYVAQGIAGQARNEGVVVENEPIVLVEL